MNKNEVYELWLSERRGVEGPSVLADRVMTALHREAQRPTVSRWGQWLVTPWAQASLACGALLVFVLRFVTLFSAAVG